MQTAVLDRGLVNERLGFVLWWHPKAACTSLKCWFLRTMGFHIARLGDGPWVTMEHGESIHSVCNGLLPYDPECHELLRHVTVPRDPRARLVSHFRQRLSTLGWSGVIDVRGPRKEFCCQTFREFVAGVCATPSERLEHHLSHQATVIPPVRIEVMPFEQLPFLWPRFLRSLGLPPRPLLSRNFGRHQRATACCADWPAGRLAALPYGPTWRSYYDDSLAAMVARKYHDDFRRFGYSRELFG